MTQTADGAVIIGAVQTQPSFEGKYERLSLDATELELAAAKSIVLRVGKAVLVIDESGAIRLAGDGVSLRAAKAVRVLTRIQRSGHGHTSDRLRLYCLLAHINARFVRGGISFTWTGAWEHDPMSGTGRARLGKDGRVAGTIKIEDGDDSTFIAERTEVLGVLAVACCGLEAAGGVGSSPQPSAAACVAPGRGRSRRRGMAVAIRPAASRVATSGKDLNYENEQGDHCRAGRGGDGAVRPVDGHHRRARGDIIVQRPPCPPARPVAMRGDPHAPRPGRSAALQFSILSAVARAVSVGRVGSCRARSNDGPRERDWDGDGG